MGIFSADVWTHCNYIAETFGDMFLTHCDTSVPTFTILIKDRKCRPTFRFQSSNRARSRWHATGCADGDDGHPHVAGPAA